MINFLKEKHDQDIAKFRGDMSLDRILNERKKFINLITKQAQPISGHLIESMLKDFDQVTKLQKMQVQTGKMFESANFKNDVMNIITHNQGSYSKSVRNLFKYERKLPGISPVKTMIAQ